MALSHLRPSEKSVVKLHPSLFLPQIYNNESINLRIKLPSADRQGGVRKDFSEILKLPAQ
jgi:hypothetical protein